MRSSIPDRESEEEARVIIEQFLPDESSRNVICHEFSTFWQYAKRNFPGKSFITLRRDRIRMTVGSVELFVIFPSNAVLLIVDKRILNIDSSGPYKRCLDAWAISIEANIFSNKINELRPGVFSIINKLGKTQKHPTAFKAHSPALATVFENEYPYNNSLDYPDEEFTFFHEGKIRMIPVNAYERDPKARKACLQHYKSYSCQICGFDFFQFYGLIGFEFIHVHHLNPLANSEEGKEIRTNPKTDLLPICPNCHAMLHTHKPEPLTPEELKNYIIQRKKMI